MQTHPQRLYITMYQLHMQSSGGLQISATGMTTQTFPCSQQNITADLFSHCSVPMITGNVYCSKVWGWCACTKSGMDVIHVAYMWKCQGKVSMYMARSQMDRLLHKVVGNNISISQNSAKLDIKPIKQYGNMLSFRKACPPFLEFYNKLVKNNC